MAYHIIPQINLNGMPSEVHIETRMAAMKQLSDLMTTLDKISPHGRDYPGREDLYYRDTEVFRERFEYLRKLETILMSEATKLALGKED